MDRKIKLELITKISKMHLLGGQFGILIVVFVVVVICWGGRLTGGWG
jgi:hypothetical protein